MPHEREPRSTHDAVSSIAQTPDLDRETTRVLGPGFSAPSLSRRAASRDLPVIDRFRASRVLGQGGMGIVYLAEDPRLGRPVALKLLSRRRGDHDAQQRMRREAQALAKLSHPNVVQVYGAGMFEDRVYIAMELVQGTDLREWQRASRSVEQILEAYRQAGAGLAAVHAKGLVHRDFKPENVVMGDDGRVRVLDFGLVRAGPSTRSEPESDERTLHDAHLAVDRLEAPLTATSVVMGTPVYMAPELHQGRPATAASDQFAFCVSLYEALYGARPFAGADLRQLVAAVLQGELQPEPEGRDVPPWLRRVVLRGLRVEPVRRWSSMDVLLEMLQQGLPLRIRRRWVAGAVGLGVLTMVGVLHAPSPSRCSVSADGIAGVWDPARKSELQRRRRADPTAAAPRLWERVDASLDDYVVAWQQVHRDACMADEGPDVLDRRMACLDERRRQLEALVDVLDAGPGTTLTAALTASDALVEPRSCLDDEELRRTMPAPEGERQAREVERIREQLAEVTTTQNLGRYGESERAALVAHEHALRVGYRPLVARTAFVAGVARYQAGALVEAIPMLEQAYFEAQTLGDAALMGYAAGWLVYAAGLGQGDVAAARRWAEHARAATEGRDDGSELVGLAGLGTVLREAGELDEARALLERVLEIRTARHAPDDVAMAGALNQLGALLVDLQRIDQGIAMHRRALKIMEDLFGREHPKVAGTLNYLAIAHGARDDLAEAARHYGEALEIWERTLGPEHLDVGVCLANLGILERKRGRLEQALAYEQRALEIWERQLGPIHLRMAALRRNMANLFEEMGRYEEAIASLRESMRIDEQLLGSTHRTRGDHFETLSRLMEQAGLDEQAHEAAQSARVLRGLPPGPPWPLGLDHSQTGSRASNSSISSK